MSYLYNRRESSDAPSEVSSTLSEFVRRRYNREVPVFGGDPRVGAAELSSAVMATLQQSGIIDVMKDLRNSLASKKMTDSGIGMAPVELVDNTKHTGSATELDPIKVQALLEASIVDSNDVAQYKHLIETAQAAIKEKELTKRVSTERKQAMQSMDKMAGDEELKPFYMSDPEAFVNTLQIGGRFGHDALQDDEFIALLNRAVIHDSVVQGKCTNDNLALIGDVVVRVILYEWTYKNGLTKGDANAIWQATQSNMAMTVLGSNVGLEQYIRVVDGLDPASRRIMSTVVEALYGAVYLAWGMPGVYELNTGPLCICDFDSLARKFKIK